MSGCLHVRRPVTFVYRGYVCMDVWVYECMDVCMYIFTLLHIESYIVYKRIVDVNIV